MDSVFDVVTKLCGADHKAPAKPEDGAPCNGCGACCAAEICCLPETMGLPYPEGSAGPCPIMVHEEGRWWCGFVRQPAKHFALKPGATRTLEDIGAEFRTFLGDGTCDSDGPAGITAASIIVAQRFRRMFG